MTPIVRLATAADLPAIRAVDEFAFGADIPDQVWEASTEAFPLERTWVAEWEGELVGQTTSHRFEVSVPGGRVAAGGVTFVAVHPAFRRKGVLRALMTRQLQALPAQDEPIALLWASEPAIYGRYGYGPAAEHLDLTVPADPAALPEIAGEAALRITTPEPADALAAAAEVLSQVAAERPGVLSTDERAWRLRTLDTPERRGRAGRLRAVVVADASGNPVGYALFAPTQSWEHGEANGSVAIRELAAVDALARSRLWRFLMSLDLMARLHWEYAPSDEPLPLMTHASRRLITGRRDSLWCRVLDVPGALERRTYFSPLDLVLEVHDGLIADCAGRWRLQSDGRTTSCEPTDRPPDLTMPVSALGSAYLGGQGVTRLADAGLVLENTPGALASASAAFGSPRDPWCPFVF